MRKMTRRTLLDRPARFAGAMGIGLPLLALNYDEFRSFLEAEQPDVVFTHWPIDSHRDHRHRDLRFSSSTLTETTV
jgi:hypothetical protein